jgi:hypothetical protein
MQVCELSMACSSCTKLALRLSVVHVMTVVHNPTVEEVEGWDVSDWQVAASWTVTTMMSMHYWEGSDIDGNADTHDVDSSSNRNLTCILASQWTEC